MADLALLDDGVGLRAEAGVHQQIVDVAQPADLAVDQVFALARSIQAARDLDVARTMSWRSRPRAATASTGAVDRGRRSHRLPYCARCRAVPVAVAVAVAAVAVASRRAPVSAATRAATPASSQAHFGGGRRLARVAAVEDHVFHRSPRRLLALCSPSTQVMASATLLLPQPLGPTMAVTPYRRQARTGQENIESGDLETIKPHDLSPSPGPGKTKSRSRTRTRARDRKRLGSLRTLCCCLGVENDATRDRMTEPTSRTARNGPRFSETAVSLTSPYTWGKRKVRPQNLGPNALPVAWLLATGRVRAMSVKLDRVGKLAQANCACGSFAIRLLPRLGNAEQREIDVVAGSSRMMNGSSLRTRLRRW